LNLSLFVVVHNIFQSLVTRINHKWISNKSLHDDGIGDAKIVVWQLLTLPQKSFLGFW